MFDNFLRRLVKQLRRNTVVLASGRRRTAEAHKSQGLQLELLEDRTLMSTFQWIGGSSQDWNDAGNWQLNGVTGLGFPNATTDIAQFTSVPTNYSNVLISQAITVGEIDFGTSANISIGTLTNNVLTLTGATKSIINALPTNTGSDVLQVSLDVANTPLAATISGGTLQLANLQTSSNLVNTIGNTSTFAVNSGGTLSVIAKNNTDAANITVNNGGTLSVSGHRNPGSSLNCQCQRQQHRDR